jgi:hypothetical protein
MPSTTLSKVTPRFGVFGDVVCMGFTVAYVSEDSDSCSSLSALGCCSTAVCSADRTQQSQQCACSQPASKLYFHLEFKPAIEQSTNSCHVAVPPSSSECEAAAAAACCLAPSGSCFSDSLQQAPAVCWTTSTVHYHCKSSHAASRSSHTTRWSCCCSC